MGEAAVSSVPTPHSPVLVDWVPSPAMFVDCPDSPPPALPVQRRRRFPRPRRNLRDDEIGDMVNLGSEASSDESDEDELVAQRVPRACWSVFETPIDAEAAADNELQESPAKVAVQETAMPHGFFDFDWKPFPNPSVVPLSRRETFSHNNVGPTTPCVDPYGIFISIWDRQFMENMVSETNRYAQQVGSQMFSNDSLHLNSRIGWYHWRDTIVDELYTYLAVVIAMGVVVKGRIEDYWKATHYIFYIPGFSACMSINRFTLISRCLHFTNNEDLSALELDSSEAKLYKIQPILSHLNNKFQSMYTLSQNIDLDESLLLWKGWLNINQLIPNKAATVGITSYEICESQTGYLWRFEIHTHKTSPPPQLEDPLNAYTPSIVLKLIRGLEHKGHTLWMDNFYNSHILARRLKSIGFDCAGTLRTNRKFVPQALHSLTKLNMRSGEITGLTSGDVDVVVWNDKNRVATISTYHGNAVARYGGSTKPIVVLDYNIMMGGVDKKDQMLAAYPVERKRTRVRYKKLFRRLLNASILNSLVIHRHSSTLSSSPPL